MNEYLPTYPPTYPPPYLPTYVYIGGDYKVRIVEKNQREAVGGRMDEYRFGKYRFETGPSLLLLPGR